MDWMRMAFEAAENSPDPSTKVGAVMINGHVVTQGWNCFPLGVPDSFWDDREKKYKHVLHAEMVALTRAGHYASGGTMFITSHPCRECAKLIVASGITCVVCPLEPWRDDPVVIETCRDAAEVLRLSGVEVLSAMKVN